MSAGTGGSAHDPAVAHGGFCESQEVHGGEGVAAGEPIVTDGDEGAGECHVHKGGAKIECMVPDGGDALGDGEGPGLTARALDEGGDRFVVEHAIDAGVVDVRRIDIDRGQVRAATERV